MKVESVNTNNKEKAEAFLRTIEKVSIDYDILNNASLLLEDDKIVGIISFEIFGSNGLIRYFIFKKIVDEDCIDDLFNNLIVTAKEKKIKRLFSFIYNKNTIPIFEYLGFFEIDKKNIYIEERNLATINKDAYIYCYNVSV